MSPSAGTPGQLARSTGVLSLATAASRLLGFIRDLLIASLFGTAAQAQAFVVAFRLPNLLRDLVAEGAVTSAVVPVLSWYRAKADQGGFWRLSHALLARLSVLLCALTLVGVVGAPPIVRLIAPGFAADPEKFALTVRLTRILFPLILLVGLWAYFMGLLNSLRHFAMPALGSAILNLAMIASCLWFVPRVTPGVVALAVGVLIGGVLQLAVQIPVAMRLGFRVRWRWSHAGSGQVLRLLGPRTLGAAAYQANVFIHTALASLASVVGEGAVAALYFANRLVQLPLALFGVASAQASLPMLAEHAAQDEMDAFGSTTLSVIRMVAFVILPASAGLIALSLPITAGLFERGAFDRHSTVMTTQALSAYSLGLLAYASSKVLSGAFYALRDTWTPVTLAIEAVVVNVVLSLALMWPFQIIGLALAASIASWLNAYRLIRGLERRLERPLMAPLVRPLSRMATASALMGVGCWAAWTHGLSAIPSWGALAVALLLGLTLYAVLCQLLDVQELLTAWRWLRSQPWMPSFVSD